METQKTFASKVQIISWLSIAICIPHPHNIIIPNNMHNKIISFSIYCKDTRKQVRISST